MNDLEVQVLVVGGGGCGLTSSIFLSDLGVDHLLVERHPTTSHLTKAHYINPRTMEIFRQHGLADDVAAAGLPTHDTTVRYVTTIGGDGELDRRDLYTFDAFGGNSVKKRYLEAAPVAPTNFPQLRLEPMLRRHAEQRAEGRVRFHHELVAFTQDDEGVTAQVRDRDRGEEYTVRAQYLVGADGGRTVAPALGVAMEGPTRLAKLKSVHVSTDLSPYVPGDALITHVMRPGTRFWWAALVPMGPTWGKHCEEWQVAFAFLPDDEDPLPDAEVPGAIREALNLPDLDLEIHGGGEWVVERVVADRFRFGRVFIGGDAAHRHVPTGGLGLNSAVHDAHNLAWKLFLATSGLSSDPARLLQSYEDERRAADIQNADWALFTWFNHQLIDVGLGVSPMAPVEANVAALAAYLSDTPIGETLRARAQEVIGTQRTEYESLDIELGFPYTSTAVVTDGTPPPRRDPMGCHYIPSTRPGHRLPHAWIENGTGRVSTHDLVGSNGGFALITGGRGASWCEAAASVASNVGIAINAVQIDHGADYTDPTGAWHESRAINQDGAILVRPDNYVAYRSIAAVQDPKQELEGVLRTILGTTESAVPSAALAGERG